MKQDRILSGAVRTFFTSPSPERECIKKYVLDNLGRGTRSVALCFRGRAATLYYRCHQLLRIRSSREGIVGAFDFRHARFTVGYREILERLRSLHVDISSFSEEGKGEQAVLFPIGSAPLAEILDIYRALIDDFFDPGKTEYAFGAPAVRHEKALYLEKERQQQLWAEHFLDGELTYYDLEYTERLGGQSGVHGRFDLLGLRREGERYTLLLTELKSSPQALGGKSGLKTHERDYLRYLDSPLLAARKREACEAVNLLFELFGRPCPKGLTPEAITDAKVQFVFSDLVLPAGKAYRPADPRLEKAYLLNGKFV